MDWTEITLTQRCNQRCFFCYEDGRDTATEPPLERVKELLQTASQQTEQVVLCGREVLLRRDILEIVAHASSLGLQPVVFTNGQALARPGLVERLAEVGCDGVVMSLHFPDEQTFARGARSKGAGFSRALDGLRRLRDYNLAHPDRPLSVSTETDMFALNAGRLADMRATLREALDPTPWRMRLACLLPSRVHDIGLDPVLDGLEQRRAELAEFIATHPPGLPLGFVKLPLCILPHEALHHCLDVQYVYEGARLTFNHLDGQRIEEDRFSASVGREIPKLLRRHPYRWICRGCQLLPLCRFERVDWELPGFAATRLQRPTPFVLPGAQSGWQGAVPLPTREGDAGEVLARLGDRPDGARWAAQVMEAAGRRPFPEEAIFAQLAAAAEQEPRLLDVFAGQEPVATLVLEVDGQPIRLHLGAPLPGRGEQALGALVGCLHVRDVTPGAPPELVRRCLRWLGRLDLPEPEAWDGDSWFDLQGGRLLQAAWRMFGEGAWPGLGGLGAWRTEAALLGPDSGLTLGLVHPAAGALELRCRLDESGELLSRLQITDAGRAALAGPVEELRRQLGGALQIQERPAAGSLSVVVRSDADADPCRFHVARFRQGQPFLRRQGELILWYSQSELDADGFARAKIVLRVMRHLQAYPPAADTASRWRRTILRAAAKYGPGGDTWEVRWEEGG